MKLNFEKQKEKIKNPVAYVGEKDDTSVGDTEGYGGDKDKKTKQMTEKEFEAMLAENNLIKKINSKTTISQE